MLTSLSRSPILAALAIVVLGLSLAACASTQDTTRNESRIALQIADINAAVHLTDAQAERIRDILVAAEANRPSGPPPRVGQGGQGGPPQGQVGGDRDVQRAEMDRQIEAVLTDAQVASYREWRASQPKQPQDGPPRRQ